MRQLITMILISLLVTSPLFARAGGRHSSSSTHYTSMGSKGSRTYEAAPGAKPITQSTTNRSQDPMTSPQSPQIGSQGSFFQRHPIMTGLASGFAGAWLYNHFFADHNTSMDNAQHETEKSWLGTLLDIMMIIAAIFGIMWLIRRFRQPTTPQAQMPRSQPQTQIRVNDTNERYPSIEESDVTKIFLAVQHAWSEGNIQKMRFFVTPEMLAYFDEQLTHNLSEGVVNIIKDPQVLRVTPLEIWRESQAVYASVKITFRMIDQTFDRHDTLVEGSNTPLTGEEIWTFATTRPNTWLLSAIEQL